MDTTSTMKFSIGKVGLDKINISYKDVITGYDIKFLLGHFDTRIKDFDMSKMKFSIPKITLSGVDARIVQTPTKQSIAKAQNRYHHYSYQFDPQPGHYRHFKNKS